MSGLIILKKIADKQAFPLALHEMIVALSGACSSATCSTHCASFFSHQRPPTRALGLFKTEQRSIARIKVFILLIPGSFHSIEYIEPPVYGMMHLNVIICTYVAHPCLTCHAIFQSFHIREFLLFMDLTVGNVWRDWFDEGVVRLMCCPVVMGRVGASVGIVGFRGLR
jgi:hypothetical protein